MRKLIFSIITVAVTAVAAVALSIETYSDSPHSFSDNECFMCHFTLPREGDAGPMRFTDGITKLCSRCHDLSKAISHQVDIIPEKIRIPADMPLDESGRLTCVTCHDIHKPHKKPTGERTFFLRRNIIGKGFCLSCHEQDSFDFRQVAAGNPTGLSVSHRPVMDKGHGFAKFELLDTDTALDSLSYACLDCHGEPGTGKKTTIGSSVGRQAKEGIGLSHPTGTDYHRATMGDKDLVREEDLDKRVKLFDGRIGCGTCHDLYAPGDGQGLVIGTRHGFQDLCFACHIK